MGINTLHTPFVWTGEVGGDEQETEIDFNGTAVSLLLYNLGGNDLYVSFDGSDYFFVGADSGLSFGTHDLHINVLTMNTGVSGSTPTEVQLVAGVVPR